VTVEPALGWPNWIGVVVDDFERQRAFYRDVLGLRELGSGDGWAHFDMGFPNVFELLQRTEEPQYDRLRYQVGFATDDIHAARAALVARGAEPVTEIAGGPESQGYWCYFRDAEGNVFELSQRLGTRWGPEPD
jgi:catechol 2,3-dioxygenase-like lactoylglutathione lyase family enzyme